MKIRSFFGLVIIGILLLSIIAPVVFSVDDPISAADELYSKRINHQNVQQAIDLLKQTLTNNPENSDILWRLARCYWFLGDRATDKKTKLALFTQGQEYAEQTITVNPNEIQGHNWLAGLLGAAGEARGIFQSLSSVEPMKKELDICVQIDPKFADAHDILAQLYWKAPALISIGNKKKALAEAKLAVANDPNKIDYWLHLGQIARVNKDYVLAREAFQQLLNLPDDPEDPEQSQSSKTIAASELKKLE